MLWQTTLVGSLKPLVFLVQKQKPWPRSGTCRGHKCPLTQALAGSKAHLSFGSWAASEGCRAKTQAQPEAQSGMGGSCDLWRSLFSPAVKRTGDICAPAGASSVAALRAGGWDGTEVLGVLPGHASCVVLAALMPPCCPSLSRPLSEENANLQEYIEKEMEEM